MLYLNETIMIFIKHLNGQPCRTLVFSTYLIYRPVIIQKTVFETCYGYSIFLVMPFQSYQCQYSNFIAIGLLYLCSVLSSFLYFQYFDLLSEW